jgi:hypothetical protein
MTSASKLGVFRSASLIMLHGDPRPMIGGVGEPVVAGLSSDDEATLARPLGDGGDSCQRLRKAA